MEILNLRNVITMCRVQSGKQQVIVIFRCEITKDTVFGDPKSALDYEYG